jgi:hypothetical protein
MAGFAWNLFGRLPLPREVFSSFNSLQMKTPLFLLITLLLTGCADSSVNGSIDGVSKPNDLVPKPWPDAPAQSTTPPGPQ